jgi:hypothetical protein
LNEIHQKKKTGANSLLCVANCGKILFYILILINFFKYETIVRFDVYAGLDCNCLKRITVHCGGLACQKLAVAALLTG